MRIFTAPDPSKEYTDYKNLFLGGGISDCFDWQSYFVSALVEKSKDIDTDSMALINPRRPVWDVNDKDICYQQIEWEYERLHDCDSRLFWFCPETLCPITLFELGKFSTDRYSLLLVGCHPKYKRRFDVIHQMKLEDSSVKVVDSVDALVDQAYNLFLEHRFHD
jgi:hypothetical protein